MDGQRSVGKEEAKGPGPLCRKMICAQRQHEMQRRAAHELEDDAVDGRRFTMVMGGGGWDM